MKKQGRKSGRVMDVRGDDPVTVAKKMIRDAPYYADGTDELIDYAQDLRYYVGKKPAKGAYSK